jgi:predicted aminopeptidase
MKLSVKNIILLFVIAIAVALALNYKLVGYAIDQAQGQAHVIWNARPINEVLDDPAFPDSLKQTLRMVEKIKIYAIDSLHLKPNDNYTTVYDQKGEEILWVVTACDPYKFEPITWSFPIIGSFTYKGFFDYDKAVDLAKTQKKDGYDVQLRSVSGWSTLGWFNDPILSNMLDAGPGELANTIIHELTHGTIFIPDSMTFNENLATFIGNRGALNYLKSEYGEGSDEYQKYKIRKSDSRKFTQHIVAGAKAIDSLYQSIENKSDSIKLLEKTKFIDTIINKMDTIEFANKSFYYGYFDNHKPNNAYFISFLNYRERQQDFTLLLEDSLDTKLSLFIDYWKSNYEKK